MDVKDGTDLEMGAILDAMVVDFQDRWGDGSNLLEFKYGQKGTGVGQPCGYTKEQLVQFGVDPRMVALPEIESEEQEAGIWEKVQTALTELIEEKTSKAGKGQVGIDGGGSQGGWWWIGGQRGTQTI